VSGDRHTRQAQGQPQRVDPLPEAKLDERRIPRTDDGPSAEAAPHAGLSPDGDSERARRAELLDQVGAAMGAASSLGARLQSLASVVLPRLGDLCVLELYRAEGPAERWVLYPYDHPPRELPTSLQVDPARELDEGPVKLLAGTERPAILATAAGPHDPPKGTQHILDALKVTASFSARLWSQRKLVGVLTLGSTQTGWRYGHEEVLLGEGLAARVAQALDSAHLYKDAQDQLRVRDEFLTIAAHELRTPTSTLRLLLQSMQYQLQTSALTPAIVERLQRTLAKSVQQCDRLVQFGERVLDVSQIRTGTLTLRTREIDLAELVKQVVNHLEGRLVHAGCTLEVNADAPVLGRWDQVRMEEVLITLLDNVIKYAAGSPVRVEVTGTSRAARLLVRDSGSGIPPGQEERIFEPFERAASVDRGGGWGLGLYVCRRVVEAHGGSIHVERAPGGGAAFVIELPRGGDQHDSGAAQSTTAV
jgi:signal transduction histidine kinase